MESPKIGDEAECMRQLRKTENDMVRQLLRTAIDIKREKGFALEFDKMESETRVLGKILAQYLDGAPRKIAEAAYAALEEAGLHAESLGLNIVWNATNPGQDDLWIPQGMLQKNRPRDWQ